MEKRLAKKKLMEKRYTEKKLKIVFLASEMAPLIKTGGLGDIVGALPHYLQKLGHEVRVILPKYSSLSSLGSKKPKTALKTLGVWMGKNEEWCTVFEIRLNSLPIYLVEHHIFFSREGLYHDTQIQDYSDNPKRFAFFCRSAIQLCKALKWKVDIFHCHDWQTALTPAYLKTWDFNDPYVGGSASLLTIHNAEHQGIYSKDSCWSYIGLREDLFQSDQFESHGEVHLLKGGIYHADLVNTVSPGYAKEISSPYGASGLAPYLHNKGKNFIGILNGVDYPLWSPEQDKKIPANYSSKDLSGKKICKSALQKAFSLPVRDKIPLFATIGRLAHQKGYYLLKNILPTILETMNLQFIILGTGEKELEDFFSQISEQYPEKLGIYIGFSEEKAHWIEAGADFFVMPSLFEPCGLTQLYSLRYGTLPIVRATGGLDDTVINYNNAKTIQTIRGTGFKFLDATEPTLYNTLSWALSTYKKRPAHMKQLIQNAMKQDFSWEKSIQKYIHAYHQSVQNKLDYDRSFFPVKQTLK